MLWPFGRRTLGGLQVVEFLGRTHANFNMRLWRREVVTGIEAGDLHAALARLVGRTDLLRLTNQPLTWAGTTNPFGLLPHQRSANRGFSGALAPDFDALLRARTKIGDQRQRLTALDTSFAGPHRSPLTKY